MTPAGFVAHRSAGLKEGSTRFPGNSTDVTGTLYTLSCFSQKGKQNSSSLQLTVSLPIIIKLNDVCALCLPQIQLEGTTESGLQGTSEEAKLSRLTSRGHV